VQNNALKDMQNTVKKIAKHHIQHDKT